MLKKILIIVGILGAAAFIAKKVKDANEDGAVWHEATTDAVPEVE